MKNPRKTRISYSIALMIMATTLSALQTHADDSMQPMPGGRMPQAAPATNNNAVPSAQSASVPAIAASTYDDMLPPQQVVGNVTYVTGGIGDEERSALDAVKKDYNLYITSAGKDGAFVGDTQISIRTPKGDELLNATAGPLFYAKLPAGTYVIEASEGGHTQKEKVTIGTKGASAVHFGW